MIGSICLPARACAALLSALVATGFTAAQAGAHGSMSEPISRSLLCFEENPETPDSDACRAVVAAGGTQPLYDWMEVNLANAAGRHRELIPDGQLCSAGRDKYRGLDLLRSDWPATALSAGAQYTFRYEAPAPHGGRFDLYVTKDGFDPTRPLRWSDLESEPFLTAVDPPLSNGEYVMPGRLPAGKSGRHLIYSTWQRSPADSPEAFYTCSDVDFGGAGTAPSTTPTIPTAGDTWGTDLEPPSIPDRPDATVVGEHRVALAWAPSSDDTGVVGYDVLAGGRMIASVEGADARVTGLLADTRYGFSVRARDAAGNVSQPSEEISVRTRGVTRGDRPGSGKRRSLSARFSVRSSWAGGYIGEIVVRNTGRVAARNWHLRFELASATTIGGYWGAIMDRDGHRVDVTPESWTRRIGPGERIRFGFEAAGESRPNCCTVRSSRGR